MTTTTTQPSPFNTATKPGTTETMEQTIARLLQENAALKQAKTPRGQLKVSVKGALSVYGFSTKWPVTLYRDQWARLFAMREEIEAFLKAHESELSVKPSKE